MTFTAGDAGHVAEHNRLNSLLYITEPGLKPPGSAHASDDEFNQANGTDPTTVGWTWGNQQAAVATIKHGKIALTHDASGTKGTHFLSKAAPGAGDVSLTTKVFSTARANFHGCGVMFLWGTLATPTRIELIKQSNNTSSRVDWDTYTGYAAGGSSRASIATGLLLPVYLRLSFTTATSGSLMASMSPDGISWVDLLSAVVTGLGRPDFMGVFIDSETATVNLAGTLDFFRVNWTPDYDPTL